MNTDLFTQLYIGALTELKTICPDAKFSYCNDLDAKSITGQVVLMTPGQTPLAVSFASRSKDESALQLAVTILDKAKPGSDVSANVALLMQIGNLFARKYVAGCACSAISFPVICDPELMLSGIYQGCVNLEFKAIG